MIQNNISDAVAHIRKYTDLEPKAGIILGSGLGSFADTLNEIIKVPTNRIPHYPASTVEGHKGYLVFGKHKGTPVLAVQGRTHFYEGYDIGQVAFVVRIMQSLGIKVLMVTNAAGATNPRFKPGDLMLITDQVNFLFKNPLSGPKDFEGTRFPDMSDAFTSAYFPEIEKIALDHGIALKKGVLWVSTGPSYETAAEVKMIQKFGGDAASMSTVPEVITAVQAGMKVIGISCITNFATGISTAKLTHDEVTETADRVKIKFLDLVTGIIENLFSRL